MVNEDRLLQLASNTELKKFRIALARCMLLELVVLRK